MGLDVVIVLKIVGAVLSRKGSYEIVIKKGIILSSGSGTGFYPLTIVYHSLSTLMLSGIYDILIITASLDSVLFQTLLCNSSQWGN